MHESRVVADLIAAVESEVDPTATRVAGLTLRIGALLPSSPSAVKAGVEHQSILAWGYAPAVQVRRSEHLDDPAAVGVTLETIQVEG